MEDNRLSELLRARLPVPSAPCSVYTRHVNLSKEDTYGTETMS